MEIDILQVIAGIFLIFFLPGYLLVKALFPGRNELDKEYNLIYEIGLGMGLSIVIVILDGFFLGSLHQLIGFRTVDGQQKGYFDTPYILGSLLSICLLLFIAAWYRGAFPWMGRLHPSLARVPASEKPGARKQRMDGLIIKLWELSRRRERLRKDVKDFERKGRSHDPEMRSHYKKKLEKAREELSSVDEEMRSLEEERAEALSGMERERGLRRERRERLRGRGPPEPGLLDEEPVEKKDGAPEGKEKADEEEPGKKKEDADEGEPGKEKEDEEEEKPGKGKGAH